MSYAKIASLLCWAMIGCAATEGNWHGIRHTWTPSVPVVVADGLLTRIKNRFFGGKSDTDNATPPPPVGVSDRTSNANGVVAASAEAEQFDQPIGEVAESIIARVNGDVILAQDVVNPIRAQLAKAPPEERGKLIQRSLKDAIDRQLLIQEAKRNLQEPIIKRMEAAADKEFGKRIEAEMQRMGVNTEAELRRKMLESGESLEQFRDLQRGNFVAQQYLRSILFQRLEVSREEMVDYYNLNREEFRKPGGVVWSEIVVTFEKCGSREAAYGNSLELVKRLRAGADFANLAKSESEGATAPNGGRWDMTAKGSYIVKAVDEAIFQLKPGKISDPIEGPKGWHIVRVEERNESTETSFVDAQETVRNLIREQKIAKESQRYVQELMLKAHITTVFDRPNQPKTPASRSN